VKSDLRVNEPLKVDLHYGDHH